MREGAYKDTPLLLVLGQINSLIVTATHRDIHHGTQERTNNGRLAALCLSVKSLALWIPVLSQDVGQGGLLKFSVRDAAPSPATQCTMQTLRLIRHCGILATVLLGSNILGCQPKSSSVDDPQEFHSVRIEETLKHPHLIAAIHICYSKDWDCQ